MTITAEEVATVRFWAVAAGIPILFYFINLTVRLTKQVPLTSGADFVMGLMSLDIYALLDQKSFASHIQYQALSANDTTWIFILLLLIGLLSWIVIVNLLEPRFSKPNEKWNCYTATCFLLSTMIAGLNTAFHFGLFVNYK